MKGLKTNKDLDTFKGFMVSFAMVLVFFSVMIAAWLYL